MTMMTMRKPMNGLHVLGWMLGFFAVVCAVNGAFVYLALSTFNGETNKNAYKDGLAFNKTLDVVKAQHALGWQVNAAIVPSGLTANVTAEYRDGDGVAINNLSVMAHFIRPISQGRDFTVALASQGEGLYTGGAPLPMPGQWLVRLEAVAQDGAPYILDYRVFVP